MIFPTTSSRLIVGAVEEFPVHQLVVHMDMGQGNDAILIITKLMYGLGNQNEVRMDVKTRRIL